jgi:hypothetical protein
LDCRNCAPRLARLAVRLDCCSLFVFNDLFERLPTIPEDLPFRVIRINSEDEVISRANNLLVGRAAYETAVRLYRRDVIQYRDRARIIARSCWAERGKKP